MLLGGDVSNAGVGVHEYWVLRLYFVSRFCLSFSWLLNGLMISGANPCFVVNRFVNCEEWRKKFGTDDLPRTFEYPEKPDVFKYYPQYYHKTDKVG
jgi:hypothetical protein